MIAIVINIICTNVIPSSSSLLSTTGDKFLLENKNVVSCSSDILSLSFNNVTVVPSSYSIIGTSSISSFSSDCLTNFCSVAFFHPHKIPLMMINHLVHHILLLLLLIQFYLLF